MKRARWGLRQTARSCSIGLDTPGWTTLSTNATCQQEKTENSAWNLVGRVPRDDSRTNAVARRGAVRNQQDGRNVRDTKPLPVRLDAVNKRDERVRNSKGGSPETKIFQLPLRSEVIEHQRRGLWASWVIGPNRQVQRSVFRRPGFFFMS